MRKNRLAFACALVGAHAMTSPVTPGAEPKEAPPPTFVYRGASDASAAVAIDRDTILVADDETNVLRVYAVGGGGPTASHDLTPFLGASDKHPELDIEGAARVGDRVYWISSHGRNKRGKLRESRHVFFATEIETRGDGVGIRGVHSPFRGLVRALVADPGFAGLGLERATRLDVEHLDRKQRQRLAPKVEGLNIEGLCASPSGERLYIGLRNPLAQGRAIVVPLLNAAAVVERQEAPRFGPPLLWNLGGSGIRSLLWSDEHATLFIVGGPTGEDGPFALYAWSGQGEPKLIHRFESEDPAWTPEALVALPGSLKLLAVSDDGALRIRASASACLDGEFEKDGTCANKHLGDPSMRTFRAREIGVSTRR